MLRFRKFMLRDAITDGGGSGEGGGAGDGGGDGGTGVSLPPLPENWHTALPEDQRSGMETYKDIPTLVKTLKHAQSMIGSDKAVIPGKDAKPEDWNAFYGKIGKPQSMEDYSKAVEIAENKMNKETLDSYKKFAFENNLLPQQAKAVVDWLTKTNAEVSETKSKSEETRINQELSQLKGTWGEKYDSNMESAKSAFKMLSDKVPGSWEWIEKSGLASEPMMFKLFSVIGETFKEGTIPGDNATTASGDVQKEINTIMADHTHPYHDKRHPNHQYEVEEMQRRFARLHPA